MKTTPEYIFNMKRRDVLKLLGIGVASVGISDIAYAQTIKAIDAAIITDEKTVTSFNNFYEFGFTKFDPVKYETKFNTKGWKITIDGEVSSPVTLSMEDVFRIFEQKEYILRLRRVEAWSMVIPWQGFAVNKLINYVSPTKKAKYIVFESFADPDQMPEVKNGSFPFPYIEALRLDEAKVDIAILATGAYNKQLLPQNGAPIRLVVPWKYGYKSAKSITRITFTEDKPKTTWSSYNPDEYGFYGNVNPDVRHKRWSQATERFISSGGVANAKRQPTMLFNGYDEVAKLYKGMDLTKDY